MENGRAGAEFGSGCRLQKLNGAIAMNADAMYRQANSRHAQGDNNAAMHYYSEAADAGHVGAMHMMGFLLEKQGKDDQAEHWFRKAIAAGNTDAKLMYNLAALLHNRGDEGESERWMRKAAEAGDAGAMQTLGGLLAKQGKDDEAEHWLRKAAAVRPRPSSRSESEGFNRSWGLRFGRSGGRAKAWVNEMSGRAEIAEHGNHASGHGNH
jgi:TPR repeat protein